MSVLLETSKGDIIIDLHWEECPIACKNFVKLCKMKYYNFSLFHNVQPGSHIQTGDPTGTGQGGDSLNRLLYGDQARFFEDEFSRKLRHNKVGTVSMANTGPNTNASQFFITTTDEQEHLDDKYVVFGEVAEGLEVVQSIAEAYADSDGRPYQNLRIRHTILLEDPFDDPAGLVVPDASPEPSELVLKQDRERIADGESLEEDADGRAPEEIERSLQDKAAKSRAEVLEMLGDIADADMKPPENVLFVCKLNPVTEDEDLEIIFSRFGECKCGACLHREIYPPRLPCHHRRPVTSRTTARSPTHPACHPARPGATSFATTRRATASTTLSWSSSRSIRPRRQHVFKRDSP